jgi:hypothetical protein
MRTGCTPAFGADPERGRSKNSRGRSAGVRGLERDHVGGRSGHAVAHDPQAEPTIGKALSGGFDLLEAKCNRCDRVSLVPLRALRQPLEGRNSSLPRNHPRPTFSSEILLDRAAREPAGSSREGIFSRPLGFRRGFSPIFHLFIAHLGTLVEAAEASSFHGRDVHEHVFSAAVGLNKSKALCRIEPLHRTCRHVHSPF